MWKENDIRLALASLAANRLRTVLTVTIIAIGITSLVGIETAIEVLTQGLAGSFRKMGTETVSLSSSPEKEVRPIGRNDAISFATLWKGSPLSIRTELSATAEASAGTRRTDPVVRIIASDAIRLDASHLELSEGRNFTSREQWKSSGICIIGDAVAARLFAGKSPIGSEIKAGGILLKVCGVLKKQGAIFDNGYDNAVITTLGKNACTGVQSPQEFSIDIIAGDGTLGATVLDAEKLMRSIRRLPPGEENDFEIISGDTLSHQLSSIKNKLSAAALVIGLITLLGASVGLMNILLVSVRERTPEIGLRKAIGEKKSSIKRKFLAEALIIGLAGGVAGIIAGIVTGNIVALAMKGNCVIPWDWIARALVICITVSLISGSVPASRAASLNPVDALREQ